MPAHRGSSAEEYRRADLESMRASLARLTASYGRPADVPDDIRQAIRHTASAINSLDSVVTEADA